MRKDCSFDLGHVVEVGHKLISKESKHLYFSLLWLSLVKFGGHFLHPSRVHIQKTTELLLVQQMILKQLASWTDVFGDRGQAFTDQDWVFLVAKLFNCNHNSHFQYLHELCSDFSESATEFLVHNCALFLANFYPCLHDLPTKYQINGFELHISNH